MLALQFETDTGAREMTEVELAHETADSSVATAASQLHAMTIAEAASIFVEHCHVAKALSVHTLRAYTTDLADFTAFVGPDAQVTSIDRAGIRAYARLLLGDRGLKATTVKRRIATMKVLFKWLEREDQVPVSVFHNLDFALRIPRRLPRALDRAEIRQLLAFAANATAEGGEVDYETLLMRFVLVVLFVTGLRINELVSAHLRDLTPEEGALRVRGKGDRERRVYLSGDRARTLVGEYLTARNALASPDGHLVTTRYGRPVTAQYVRRRLRVMASRAGIARRVTPHMLRHTAATQLLEAGVDIRFVQRLLGHSSIVTTQIYAEVHDLSLKAALASADTLSRVSVA